MNIDRYIQQVKARKVLTEAEFNRLADAVIELLLEQPNLLRLQTPIAVCGDIHGQFYDLLKLFQVAGGINEQNYLFLGDYVDRGNNSVETLQLLLLLKLKHPTRIHLLRGNHETRSTSAVYGFYEECKSKYGNANVWKACCDLFDYMPIAAVINSSIFCVHGGLSPELKLVDQLRLLNRFEEIPTHGPICDIVWSDPGAIQSWKHNERGAGWMFGQKVVSRFNRLNGFSLICRAHQLANEGYQYWFDEQLVTIWSAPNYCKKCGNSASVLLILEQLEQRFESFQEAPEPANNKPFGQILPYFL